MGYRIAIDRGKCQGIGACVGVAPEIFELDNAGKAVLIKAGEADDDTVLEAAESCPLEAIALYDDDGEQMYP